MTPYPDRVAADPAEGGFRGDGVVIAAAAGLFGVGIALLGLGVWVDLPGPLAAYGDPQATWPLWLQVGLGLAAFLTWRWVNRRRNRAFTVVLLGIGVASVFVLGVAAYSRCHTDDQSPWWSVVSRVLSLMLNNYNTDDFAQQSCEIGAAPLALQFAHLAQLTVLLVAATSAVRVLLRGQFDRLVVRFSRKVFLAVAVDDSAAPLLPSLASGAHGSTRAIVTKDPAAAWLSAARTAGWRIVTGDSEDPAILRNLLARPGDRHALTGLAVLSPDSVRTQRLMHSVDSALRGLRGDASVRALLRIDDAWQAEDWRRRYLGQPGRWVVDAISENEVTARLIALDARARGVTTLVLVGRSGLTFALLAEVAQEAREAAVVGDAAGPRIVLVDPLAQRVWAEHLLAQRGFGMVAEEADVRDQEEVEEVVEALGDDGTAVVFTAEPEAEDQRLASRLGVLHPDLVVYSRRAEVSGVGGTPLLAKVVAYGTTLDAGAGRPIDRWERIARLVHESYARAHPDPGNPGRLPWDGGLAEFYRASNIRQVITTLGAAVEVGRTWTTSTAVDDVPPTDEQLDKMAEIEHESWRRHQADYGRTHPDMVPWDSLSPESRAKNRAGVVESLGLLATLGYRSFDDPDAQWRSFRREGEVTAVQRDEGWDWFSSRGDPMRGHAGDWEVSDARGSRAVSAASFPLTHEHIEGDRYLRVGVVDARRAIPGEVAVSPEGSATAGPGQWLLRNPVTEEEWLVSDAHFRASYVAVPGQDGQ